MNRSLHLLLSLIHTEERTGLLLLVLDTTTVVTLAWQEGEIVSTHAGVLEGQAVLDLLARPGHYFKRWRWFDRATRGLDATRAQPTLESTGDWLTQTAVLATAPDHRATTDPKDSLQRSEQLQRIRHLLNLMVGDEGHLLFKRHMVTHPPEADWDRFVGSLQAPITRWFGPAVSSQLTEL